MTNIIAFIKKFALHICIMFVIVIVLIIFISQSLSSYTNHGDKHPIPDFTGLPMDKAEEIANLEDLKLRILDSIHDQNTAKGCIVAQVPQSGMNVKRGRSVYITINATSPEMIAMPDLVNISLRQAQSLIEIYGLKQGKLKYAPDFAKNYVLAQMVNGEEIEKGTKIKKGTKIDLLLGLGDSNQDTYIPQLTGLTFDEVQDKIHNASLNVGAKIFDGTFATSEDSSKAIVIKQLPTYVEGASVKVGSLIDIWLANPDEIQIEEPALDVLDDEIIIEE